MRSEEPDEEGPLVLVLVGKTGVGKSTTANTLIGRDVFESRRAASAVTACCQSASTRTAGVGRAVHVLDTPGLSDPETPDEELWAEIIRGVASLAESCGAGARFALLLVLSCANRVDEDELRAFGSLGRCFGARLYEHSLIVQV